MVLSKKDEDTDKYTMKLEDKVRNVSAGLSRLAEHYDVILSIKKVKGLRSMLTKILGESIEAETIINHALELNRYCLKYHVVVKRMVKKKGVDTTFFEFVRRVFEDEETQEVIKTVKAILAELESSILAQRSAVHDLTYVEREEFIHLTDWGLKHSIGKKKRLHVTDFAYKLERKIHWIHGDEKHNDKLFRSLVEQEKDLATRQVHLYIISLIKLKHIYENLDEIFSKQLDQVEKEKESLKTLTKESYHDLKFQKHVLLALESARGMKELVSAEGPDMIDLLSELKEIEHRIPKIEFHKSKKKGPFLILEGHPVQIEDSDEKHPHRIQLPYLFNLKDSDSLLFGSNDMCHVLMHHAAEIHARIARRDDQYFLYNEANSPGTFVIRKKQPVCIVQDKQDQKQLVTRMNMPGEDYADIVRKGKLTFKITPQDGKGFKLQDMDLIVIPPGYKFRFSEK